MRKEDVLQLNREIPDAAVSAEYMLNHIGSDKRESKNDVLGIKFTTGIIQPGMRAQVTTESNITEGLNRVDIPYVLEHVFDDSLEVVNETVRAINPQLSGNIEEMTVARLQYGYLAYILMCGAQINGKTVPFVTYLSRGPKEIKMPGFSGGSLSDYGRTDYELLRAGSSAFEQKLPTVVRDRIDIVKPIAMGDFKYKGGTYFYFTMPFVPFGELGVYIEEFKDVHRKSHDLILPYFGYAIPWNLDMEKTQRTQFDGLKKRAFEMMAKKTQTSEEYESFVRQYVDLILGECLVHAVTGLTGYHHEVRAGDWMAAIGKRGLKLRLITFRGAGAVMDRQTFINRLLEHKELVHSKFKGGATKDFRIIRDCGFDRRALEEIYETAESMILQ